MKMCVPSQEELNRLDPLAAPKPVSDESMLKRLDFVAAYKELCDKYGCFILCEGETLEVSDDAGGMIITRYWTIDRAKGMPGNTAFDRWQKFNDSK